MRYRTAVNGYINVCFKSIWVDRHRIHAVPMDKSLVDLVCVYSPDTGQCYYIDPKEHQGSVQLRLVPSRNNQKKKIHLAEAFKHIPTP